MKRLPLKLAGALLLAGSLSAYAQTERLPRDQEGGAAKQAPSQDAGGQDKPRINSQEQPRVNDSQGAQPEKQREQTQKSGDRPQDAQADSKEKREGDAGKQQGRDQPAGSNSGASQQSSDNAKAGKHAGKKLEAKQRTVVKETIVKRNVRPVHVNFSISVGAVVPRTVTLYDLPPVLIEYEPSYSRYKFILADDDTILVIDPETWTIVDIIEV